MINSDDDWKSYKETFEKRMAEFKESLAELDYQTDLSIAYKKGYRQAVFESVSDKMVTPEQGANQLGISVEGLKEDMLRQGYNFPDSLELSASSEDSYPKGFFSLFGSASDLNIEDDPEEN